MSTLGQTTALCPVCRKTVPAKVVVAFSPEIRGQRAEARGQKSEVRAQRAESGNAADLCPLTSDLCPPHRGEGVATDFDAGEVHFISFCPEHGEHRRLVRRDVQAYLQAQRNVKPAWIPRETSGRSDVSCPEGCGICDRHEQHLCLPIIEITNRCDLSCPICLVDAGDGTSGA